MIGGSASGRFRAPCVEQRRPRRLSLDSARGPRPPSARPSRSLGHGMRTSATVNRCRTRLRAPPCRSACGSRRRERPRSVARNRRQRRNVHRSALVICDMVVDELADRRSGDGYRGLRVVGARLREASVFHSSPRSNAAVSAPSRHGDPDSSTASEVGERQGSASKATELGTPPRPRLRAPRPIDSAGTPCRWSSGPTGGASRSPRAGARPAGPDTRPLPRRDAASARTRGSQHRRPGWRPGLTPPCWRLQRRRLGGDGLPPLGEQAGAVVRPMGRAVHVVGHDCPPFLAARPLGPRPHRQSRGSGRRPRTPAGPRSPRSPSAGRDGNDRRGRRTWS